MAIFSNKNKEGYTVANFAMFDGIPQITKGLAISVSLLDDELEIKVRLSKLPSIKLKYSQIINVELISEKEILEKDKSVIGRAAAGGLILGPLGAIIGGLSGTGKKKKTKLRNFVVINYHSAENQVKVLSFEVVGATLGLTDFIIELKGKTNLNVDQQATPQYL